MGVRIVFGRARRVDVMREMNLWRTAALTFVVSSGVCTAITMLFAFVVLQQREPSVSTGVRAGVATGLLFTAGVFVTHVRLGRIKAGGRVPDVSQSEEVVLKVGPESSRSVVESAFRELGVRRISVSGGPPLIVSARTSASWKSWGETVIGTVTPMADGRSVVRIESRPLLPIAFVDYGKGAENVGRCIEALRSAQ